MTIRRNTFGILAVVMMSTALQYGAVPVYASEIEEIGLVEEISSGELSSDECAIELQNDSFFENEDDESKAESAEYIDNDCSNDAYYKYYKPYEKATYELKYHIQEDGNICIDDYIGDACGKLTIPGVILGNNVTVIGDNAFGGSCFSGNLTIPGEVKVIGNEAFGGCNDLRGTLTISEGVESIGDNAFGGCGFWGDLIIPGSVTTIGNEAFGYCDRFKGNLIISEGVTAIGNSAFSGCSGFTGNLIIPESVKTIGDGAFSECYGFAGSLTISEGVTAIGEGAFSGCFGFTGNLIIPGSVETIGVNAFASCRGFDGNLIISEGVKTIGGGAFGECTKLSGELIIPGSVTTIGDYAFYCCRCLTGSLTIPGSVTSIGEWAFYSCTGFTDELIIQKGVTTIGEYAFLECVGFTGDLILPEGLTSIGKYAFGGCEGFTGNITIPEGVTSISDYAFGGCYWFEGELIIPRSVTSISETAFCDCIGLNKIINNSSVSLKLPITGGRGWKNSADGSVITTIANGTAIRSDSDSNEFDDLEYRYYKPYSDAPYKLKYHIQEDGNICIDGYRGTDGNKLVIPSIILGNRVTAIGDYAFSETRFTGDLIIPDSVVALGENAFSGAGAVKYDIDGNEKPNGGNVTIPGSIKTISESAFVNSNYIGDLIIQDGVETIGDNAFDGSKFKGNLTIPGSIKTIPERAFYCCKFSGKLTIKEGVETIGGSAFANCTGFTGNIVIPGSVKTIGTWAFGCAYGGYGNERNLIIQEGVETIGYSAFWGDRFEEIIIPESVMEIGERAFYSSSSNAAYNTPVNILVKKIKNSSSISVPLPEVIGLEWRDASDGSVITEIANGTAIRSDYKEKETEPDIIDEIENDKGNDITIVAGQKINLKEVCFANVDETISRYVVDNKKFASVSKDMLSGSKAGTVKVTAQVMVGKNSYEDIADCTVTVLNKPKLKFSQPMKYIGYTINASDYFTTEDTKSLGATYWESSNPAVVEVIDPVSGKLEAHNKGNAKITAYFGQKGEKGTFKVTASVSVKYPEFQKSSYNMQTGAKLTLGMKNVTAAMNPEWSAEDDTIINVYPQLDKKGNATGKVIIEGLSYGNTKLKVKIDGQEYKCDINVVAPKINKTKLTIKSGKSAALSLSNTKIKKDNVKWESSNKSIAIVDEKGKVWAISEGTATIFTYTGGIRSECVVTVSK